eukprot:403332197
MILQFDEETGAHFNFQDICLKLDKVIKDRFFNSKKQLLKEFRTDQYKQVKERQVIMEMNKTQNFQVIGIKKGFQETQQNIQSKEQSTQPDPLQSTTQQLQDNSMEMNFEQLQSRNGNIKINKTLTNFHHSRVQSVKIKQLSNNLTSQNQTRNSNHLLNNTQNIPSSNQTTYLSVLQKINNNAQPIKAESSPNRRLMNKSQDTLSIQSKQLNSQHNIGSPLQTNQEFKIEQKIKANKSNDKSQREHLKNLQYAHVYSNINKQSSNNTQIDQQISQQIKVDIKQTDKQYEDKQTHQSPYKNIRKLGSPNKNRLIVQQKEQQLQIQDTTQEQQISQGESIKAIIISEQLKSAFKWEQHDESGNYQERQETSYF